MKFAIARAISSALSNSGPFSVPAVLHLRRTINAIETSHRGRSLFRSLLTSARKNSRSRTGEGCSLRRNVIPAIRGTSHSFGRWPIESVPSPLSLCVPRSEFAPGVLRSGGWTLGGKVRNRRVFTGGSAARDSLEIEAIPNEPTRWTRSTFMPFALIAKYGAHDRRSAR